MTAFWDIAPCSMVEVDRRFRGSYCLHHQGALAMEAVRTSETSVNYYTSRRNIPEGCHLHTRHRKDLKSHRGKLYKNKVLRTISRQKSDEITMTTEKFHEERQHV
jgi:hypothetical protein